MIQLNKTLPENTSHSFARVPGVNIERSTFDRKHSWTGTLDAGELVCNYMDEMLPGDTFDMSSAFVLEMQPTKKPIMDNLYVDGHYWFVPYRLVWENFERMMGQRDDPADSIDFLAPIVTWTNADGKIGFANNFSDCGWPQITPTVSLSGAAGPFRALAKTWNNWYRDENLQDSLVVPVDDGPDAITVYNTRFKRGKRHDYFTSCLPFVQKGDPVSVSLAASTAPVEIVTGVGTPGLIRKASDDSLPSSAHALSHNSSGEFINALPTDVYYDPDGTLAANLSSVTVLINDLRYANMVQELLERDARGGTRFTEIVRSHFGVVSPDARLQRPEFLGSWSQPIRSMMVPQTSPSSGSDPQAQLAAYTRDSGFHHGFRYSATEHGFVFCLVSIRADLNYQQGLRKMWNRRSRYDFYMPVLAHLGEQPVYNKEIYAIGDDGTQDDAVFGYQEAWADYRYFPSLITGKVNSLATGTLDLYNVSQNFGSLPTLSSDFIEEDPDISRVVFITTEPAFVMNIFHNLKCTRPLPVYSIPQLSSRM